MAFGMDKNRKILPKYVERSIAEKDRLGRAIHAAARAAGLVDRDAYEDMLAAQTGGKRSSTDCTEDELRAVLTHLNGGSKGKSTPFKPSARADVRLIYALWGQAKRDGILKNPTPAGLAAFCVRWKAKGTATKPDFLTPSEAAQAIEALKAMIRRGKADG